MRSLIERPCLRTPQLRKSLHPCISHNGKAQGSKFGKLASSPNGTQSFRTDVQVVAPYDTLTSGLLYHSHAIHEPWFREHKNRLTWELDDDLHQNVQELLANLNLKFDLIAIPFLLSAAVCSDS